MAGIDGYLNTYYNPYAMSYSGSTGTGSTSSANSIFDVGAAQSAAKQQAQQLLDSIKGTSSQVTSLKTDTSKFMDQYSLSMKQLGQSSEALRGDNLDKLLYNKEGNITDDTVANTVKSFQNMVDSYNSTLKLLNDNADRGAGTTKQLARMVTDPAPEAAMKLVGVTVNKDGTLALDAEKMSAALKTENEGSLKLYKDIIGGLNGIADGVNKDAKAGSNVAARQLISNDLAQIQQEQYESNPFAQMKAEIGGRAYGLMNMAAAGMLMNMLA